MTKKRSKPEKVDKFTESLKEEETEIDKLEREIEEEEKAITIKQLPEKKGKRLKKGKTPRKSKILNSKENNDDIQFSKSLIEDEDEIKRLEESIKEKKKRKKEKEGKNLISIKLRKKERKTTRKDNKEEEKFTKSLIEDEDEIKRLEEGIKTKKERKKEDIKEYKKSKNKKSEDRKERKEKIRELPSINLPKISLPKVHLPKIDQPQINLSKISIPKLDSSRIKLPKISIPSVKLPKINIKVTKRAILVTLILFVVFSSMWIMIDKFPEISKLINNKKSTSGSIMVYSPGNNPIQPCCDEKQEEKIEKEVILKKRLYSYEVIADYLKDMNEADLILEQHTALEVSCEAIITENDKLCKEIEHEESKITCTTLTLLKTFSKTDDECKRKNPKDKEICEFSKKEYHTNCEQYKNSLLKQMCMDKITLKGLDCSSFKDSKKNEILCECFKHE